MTALSDQLAKLNPSSGASQLLSQVQTEQAQARQAAAMAAPQSQPISLEAIDAGRAQRDEAQALLEQEHSQLATVATQAGRGALAVLLGSGALAGLAAEGAGAAFGSEGLERFGRELGESSTGTAALQALAFGGGGGGTQGLDRAEQAKRDIEGQQQAWPMLSAVSHVGGQLAGGVALGGLASGASKGALVAAGALEGAAGGAQVAYESNASLRDVVSSAMLGGLLGGAAGGAAVGLPALLKSRGLKAQLRELASESALKATGARGSDIRRLVAGRDGAAAAQKIDEIGQELLTYEMRDGSGKLLRAGMKAEDLVEGVGKAKQELGEALGTMKGEIDAALRASPPDGAASLAPDVGAYLQRVEAEVLAPLRSSNVGSQQRLVDMVDRELAPLREKLTTREAMLNAEPQRVRLPDGSIEMRPRNVPEPITFAELDKTRQDLAAVIYKKPAGGGIAVAPEHAQELMHAERILADHLNESAERALTVMGRDTTEFAKLRKQFSNMASIEALVNKASKQDLGNRAFSLTDTLAGVGGAGILGMPGAALSAIAHKVVRERSRSAIAVIANNLVLDTVRPAMERLLPGIELGAVGALSRSGGRELETSIGSRELAPLLSREEKQERYKEQLATVTKAIATPDPAKVMRTIDGFADLPPNLTTAAGADMAARLQQLHADMPKPEPNVRGKAYETLSSEQVRLTNAMYEATTDPMSVFEDFARGDVDYDKVQYAWKQYPGLKVAVQAGLMDALQIHLDEDTRAAIPDATMSQLDYLFAFEGELQPTVEFGFAQRMTEVAAAEAQQAPRPDETGPMQLPTAKPTFTQRLSGAA